MLSSTCILAYEQSAKAEDKGFVYCASKGLAERAAWEYKDLKFLITTISPRKCGLNQQSLYIRLTYVRTALIYGPPHQAFSTLDSVNTSTGEIWSIINSSSSEPFAVTGLPVGTDVRDIADLHVKAIERPEISANQRFMAVSFHIFNSESGAILRDYAAGDQERLARIRNGGGDVPYPHFETDSHEAEELLGRPFIGSQKSIIDTAERLWEIEAILNKKE